MAVTLMSGKHYCWHWPDAVQMGIAVYSQETSLSVAQGAVNAQTPSAGEPVLLVF